MIDRIVRSLRNAALGLAFVRDALREPVTLASALAAVRARLAERPRVLVDMLERAVFGHSGSPYRPLLEAAGYDLERLRRTVAEAGVEGALERLHAAGVYITIEEFKGLREAQRGGRSWRFTPRDFDNPLVTGGLVASSGATRSRGIPSLISGANLVLGAQHLALALDAYRVGAAPVIVWLPTTHGASLWAVLVLLAMGKPPPRWFTQLPDGGRPPQHRRPFQLAIRAWVALHGVQLPRPTLASLADPSPLVRFIGEAGRHGIGVFTTPSAALRLARTGREAGVQLDGVTFVTIGEPLTPAKRAGIEAARARAYSSLGFTEFGRATYGCANPAGPDDTHVCRDALALGRRRRPAAGSSGAVDALLFTSLRPDARKILLNVESGDYARASSRRCGCPLEAAGWTEHLEDIRSFEKLNAEGALLFGSQLVAVMEERLPARFGGDPTDYQLVEEEDADGFTRLSLLVHPRLGPLDETAIHAGFRDILQALRPAPIRLWAQAETFQVRRQPPLVTGAGKLLPLLHLGSAEGVAGEPNGATSA